MDKASDVMDSVESEPLFDELFVHGLQHPESIEQECDDVITQIREKIADARQSTDLLADGHVLEADDARKWRDHPAQFWLERAITHGLPARGGSAIKVDTVAQAWRVNWGDGSEPMQVCFDARTAEQHPELEWVTLEDPRARALISELPRCVAGQPLPIVRIGGLPYSIRGVWSLWEISLSAEGFNRRRFLPLFATDDGRTFVPTAKRIWDLLLTEQIELLNTIGADAGRTVPGVSGAETDATHWFDLCHAAASTQGERLFSELMDEHNTRLKEERERAQYAYDARYQAIGRIGLPAVREHRRRRLDQEHQVRMAALDDASACLPDLNAVMMLRVGTLEIAGVLGVPTA